MVYYSESTPHEPPRQEPGGLELMLFVPAESHEPPRQEAKASVWNDLCFGAIVFPSFFAPLVYGASDAMDPGMPYRGVVMPAALLPYLLFKPKSKDKSGEKMLGFKAKMVRIGALAEGIAYCAGYALASAIDMIF